MDAAALDRLLGRLGHGGSPLFLLHVNADADCVASAFALQRAFGGVVGAADGLSREGKRLAEALGLAVDGWPAPDKHDPVVAVDTSSRSQLGRYGPGLAPCLVDHHAYGDLREHAPAYAWDATRPSCAEVALAVLDRAGKPLTREVAFALAAGIASDTARFRHADGACLRTMARVLEASGATMDKVLEVLDSDDEDDAHALSRRLASMHALQRCAFETVGDCIVVSSEVGAFDAGAAASLVRAGADVAVVVNERANGARMSLRASRRALDAGLHCGHVANEAARLVGWSGGGHDGAAGLSGKPPAAAALDAVLSLLRAKLKEAA